MLAVAASAADARNSGQGGLFGLDEVKQPDIQIPAGVHWSLAERMAQEKEAFGFYFSAHPVDRFRHIADANGAKSFGLICRSEEHTSELQSLMSNSYAVFCLKKKNI